MIIKRNCKFKTSTFGNHPFKNKGILFSHEGYHYAIYGHQPQIYKIGECREPNSFKRFNKRLAAEFIEQLPDVMQEGHL